MDRPIAFRWTGDAFEPLSGHWAREADKVLVVGEVYRLVEHHDRSTNSHRHYFVVIADAWRTLPDQLIEQYPSAEHLRKKALIWKGYRDERTIVSASHAEAERVAAFIKPMDDFAVVIVRDSTVRVWTAKSQSMKAMGNRDFQASKTDVLEFIDDLLGVEHGSTAKSEAA